MYSDHYGLKGYIKFFWGVKVFNICKQTSYIIGTVIDLCNTDIDIFVNCHWV